MKTRCLWIAAAFSAAFSALSPASGEDAASKLFADKESASDQSPAAIGSYAKGCAAGSVQLAETGPTWQAMRLSRNRNWGHPSLIEFIETLSARAAGLGWSGLYIGDLSQPRGGPMPSGHRSHQIGLDVDIWMLPAHRLDLTRQERDEISSISVRTEDQKSVNGNWTETHMEILKSAAESPAVDRIFVAAAVKKEMCETAGKDRAWLQKIRPLYGHNYHFHVRLKCPEGSEGCITQTPTVAELSKGGDGCDSTLDWWLTGYLDQLKKPPPKDPPPPRRHPRDYLLAELPKACAAVLNAT